MANAQEPGSAGQQVPSEELPPVEPPTAGLIVQLFVIPLVIVLAVVLVWLLFGSIAAQEQDPREYVAALNMPSPERRWRAAHGLAQLLESSPELADDRNLAQELADQLDRELQRGGDSDQDVRLRGFLATALGKFNFPDVVMPVLRKAIRPSEPIEVRFRAIAAVGDLAERLDDVESPQVVDQLIEASRDVEPLVRKLSAFALGMLASADALDSLGVMLADSNADVRYNAALALARNGRPAAVPVLARMLDPENPDGVSDEHPGQQQYKASVILLNALEGTSRLMNKNPDADVSQLEAPLETLTRHPLRAVRLSAGEVLRKVRER